MFVVMVLLRLSMSCNLTRTYYFYQSITLPPLSPTHDGKPQEKSGKLHTQAAPGAPRRLGQGSVLLPLSTRLLTNLCLLE